MTSMIHATYKDVTRASRRLVGLTFDGARQVMAVAGIRDSDSVQEHLQRFFRDQRLEVLQEERADNGGGFVEQAISVPGVLDPYARFFGKPIPDMDLLPGLTAYEQVGHVTAFTSMQVLNGVVHVQACHNVRPFVGRKYDNEDELLAAGAEKLADAVRDLFLRVRVPPEYVPAGEGGLYRRVERHGYQKPEFDMVAESTRIKQQIMQHMQSL